jgi:hypothetical protein
MVAAGAEDAGPRAVIHLPVEFLRHFSGFAHDVCAAAGALSEIHENSIAGITTRFAETVARGRLLKKQRKDRVSTKSAGRKFTPLPPVHSGAMSSQQRNDLRQKAGTGWPIRE